MDHQEFHKMEFLLRGCNQLVQESCTVLYFGCSVRSVHMIVRFDYPRSIKSNESRTMDEGAMREAPDDTRFVSELLQRELRG